MFNEPTRVMRKRPVDVDRASESYLGTLAAGEKITASIWDVPVGLGNSDAAFTDNAANILLSGGTDGVSYTVTNQVTTNKGRTLTRQAVVEVRAF